jgi:hypothetical protein
MDSVISTQIKIEDYIKPLFPHGTRGLPGDISEYPVWPLDIFGAAAYALKSFDAYTAILDHSTGGAGIVLKDGLSGITAVAALYRSAPSEPVPRLFLEAQWPTFIKGTICPLEPTKTDDWLIAAIKLVVFCDLACSGIGFPKKDDKNWILLTHRYRNHTDINISLCTSITDDWSERWEQRLEEIDFGHSLQTGKPYPTGCLLIPPSYLCVLPKSRTPMVGCTLRSLTHNLSLHPGAGQITSYWFALEPESEDQTNETCKVMIIPYPYRISSKSFKHDHSPINQKFSTFSFSPIDSIEHSENESGHIGPLVASLLNEAKAESIDVDFIVFPELALNANKHAEVAKEIKKFSKTNNREIVLIAGVEDKVDSLPLNISHTTLFRNGDIWLEILQAKHHRWKLDADQIRTYGLSNILDPKKDYWENTKIDDRDISYVVFKKGVSFTTLICEDLARSEPCIDSLQSVGPNLIFSLLMDGPQIKGRWPERNALGFSDDPGSSVLTLTSLGMVRRSNAFHNGSRNTVALWRDPKWGTREIDLPLNSKAMILGLERSTYEETSLDGRGDGGTAHRWILKEISPLLGD